MDSNCYRNRPAQEKNDRSGNIPSPETPAEAIPNDEARRLFTGWDADTAQHPQGDERL